MPQLSLLNTESCWEILDLPEGSARLFRNFYDPRDAADLLQQLIDNIPWRQDHIELYGKKHPLPRLQQWFGDDHLTYTWSGIAMVPLPWTPLLQRIRTAVEQASGHTFNTVLVNRYRSGEDSVAWHSDNEKEFGTNPVIGSVSFGAARDFLLKHASRSDLAQRKILLEHGSLLIMEGATQENWVHCIPRRLRVHDERINLTFRKIVTTG